MTIQNLTNSEISERTAAYMKRSLADLRSLAQIMGLSIEGRKADLVARIVSNSGKAEVSKPQFDMTGLYIRC